MSAAFKCDYCGTLTEGVPFSSKSGGSNVYGANFLVSVDARDGTGKSMEICKDCAERFVKEAFHIRAASS